MLGVNHSWKEELLPIDLHKIFVFPTTRAVLPASSLIMAKRALCLALCLSVDKCRCGMSADPKLLDSQAL